MKDQDPAGPVVASGDQVRSVGVLRGITGKVAAVVAALLVVFIVSATVLLSLVSGLQKADPDSARLTTGRQTALSVLVEFQEQLRAFDQVLVAGTDAATRTRRMNQYRASDDLVEQLLQQAIRELPADRFRQDTQDFLAKHTQWRAVYGRALDAFVASGGRNVKQAAAAVENLETDAFTAFEQSTSDMRIERDRLNAAQLHRVSAQITRIWIVGGVLLLLITALAAFVLRRVVGPIRALTRAAERIARSDLPRTVGRIRELQEGEEPPALPRITVRTKDETSQLADAFHSLQSSAVGLAVEQRQAELDAAQMLVNLGRRNQNLLNRTLAYITELERTE